MASKESKNGWFSSLMKTQHQRFSGVGAISLSLMMIMGSSLVQTTALLLLGHLLMQAARRRCAFLWRDTMLLSPEVIPV
jgi:hypothetical protein